MNAPMCVCVCVCVCVYSSEGGSLAADTLQRRCISMPVANANVGGATLVQLKKPSPLMPLIIFHLKHPHSSNRYKRDGLPRLPAGLYKHLTIFPTFKSKNGSRLKNDKVTD